MALTRAIAAMTFVVAFFVARPAHADPKDRWIAEDKALHAGVSAVLAGGGYAASTLVVDARGHALLLGGGVALAAGVGKEVLDMTGFGTPSWKDFAADAVGVAVGLALAWTIDVLIRGISPEHPALASPHVGVTRGALVYF